MKLHLRRPAKKRLPTRARVPLYVPMMPDAVWSADFMSDALIDGRRFRLLNVVDDFNREALHIEVYTSITSERLVRIFGQLLDQHGLPQLLRTDNGAEFLGEAFTSWAKGAGMAIQYIQSREGRIRTPTSSVSIAPVERSCWTGIYLPR